MNIPCLAVKAHVPERLTMDEVLDLTEARTAARHPEFNVMGRIPTAQEAIPSPIAKV